MGGANLVNRAWVYEILPDEVRVRVSYQRAGKRIEQYLVQLEIMHRAAWQPVVRYDNAHGFCHCDTIHPDGSQEKTILWVGDADENFTRAVREVNTNWQAHRDRFLGEIKP